MTWGEDRIEVGDLVDTPEGIGTVIGFNRKGEGGRHFVHVFIAERSEVMIFSNIGGKLAIIIRGDGHGKKARKHD